MKAHVGVNRKTRFDSVFHTQLGASEAVMGLLTLKQVHFLQQTVLRMQPPLGATRVGECLRLIGRPQKALVGFEISHEG